MIIVSLTYSSALVNYGFAKGDIGTALYQFAEDRSSLRTAIGFDDETAINNAVAKYEENKALFEKSFAQMENTIISKESREIYNQIKAELPDFWAQADEVIEIGAVTDRARCLQAQEIAINELTYKFASIYEKTESLLERKVANGNTRSAV